VIVAENISVQASGKSLLHNCSLTVRPGRLTALLGPNGAGKSTFISVLSGERRPDQGEIRIADAPLEAFSPMALARQRAVLLQNSSLDFAFIVSEVVNLGRLPYATTQDALDDDEAVAAACRMADIIPLLPRLYQTLSGGERQRVQYARALAQIWRRPNDLSQRYLFLDEPTSALDLRHRRALLKSVRELVDQGVGVLAVLHDLNLAADYADDIALLVNGGIFMQGPTREIMTADNLEQCFDVPVEVMHRENGKAIVLA
tara:strand:- start:16314 stop:17090 length:777 start_codon:yes stop_codon:yes gene_type:complete